METATRLVKTAVVNDGLVPNARVCSAWALIEEYYNHDNNNNNNTADIPPLTVRSLNAVAASCGRNG